MPICPKCHEQNPQLGAKCPRDGHYYIPESALEDAEKDAMIGRLAADKYVVLSLISEGGMGAVYRALQLPVEREVAFKVLRAELKGSDQGHERFVREARAVSRLTHPNIITLHDFGLDSNGHPFMVMEYAPGESLAKWIRRDDLDIRRIVHVAEQVLAALTEAHQQGIVHRDLKPENIIIKSTGGDPDFVKLLDFGIARLINEGATQKLTREGEVFGTPHYMAPEQAQGKKSIGPPADVYAMGIILYEMITGECPFDAATPLAVLFMHINEELPEIEPRPGLDFPQPIRDIIRAATSKDQKERFQTAQEMLQAIRRCEEDLVTGRMQRPRRQQVVTGPANGSTSQEIVTQASDASSSAEVPAAARSSEVTSRVASSSGGPTIAPDDDQRKKIGMAAVASLAVLILLVSAVAALVSDDDDTTAPDDDPAAVTEQSSGDEPTDDKVAPPEGEDEVATSTAKQDIVPVATKEKGTDDTPAVPSDDGAETEPSEKDDGSDDSAPAETPGDEDNPDDERGEKADETPAKKADDDPPPKDDGTSDQTPEKEPSKKPEVDDEPEDEEDEPSDTTPKVDKWKMRPSKWK